mmetsp:Transcript_3177/g.4984  ORF Transcript_3177/g.4984 Transcript_3177/m.4984 type:complete len:322 (+) Transcript_3177:54-1019(+)
MNSKQTQFKSPCNDLASSLRSHQPGDAVIVDLTAETNGEDIEVVGVAKTRHPAKKCRTDTTTAMTPRKSVSLDAGGPGPIDRTVEEYGEQGENLPSTGICMNGNKGMTPMHSLPSTGSDVLLVGARTLCHPLANALVRCKFGSSENESQSTSVKGKDSSMNKRKLSSSRMTVTYSLNARHVRLTQTLPLDSNSEVSFPRVDFIVIVLSVRDVKCFDFLRECIASLHSDYLLNRCAIVVLHTMDRAMYGVPNSEVRDLLSPNESSRKSIFAEHFQKVSTLPVFPMNENDDDSCAVVARMLLQSVKLCSRGRSGVSPLFSCCV